MDLLVSINNFSPKYGKFLSIFYWIFILNNFQQVFQDSYL